MSLVKQFHQAFGLPAPGYPMVPDQEHVRLRMRLIKEEYEEVRADLVRLLQADLTYEDAAPILRDLLKELADLRYVVEGTAVAFGLPIDAAYAEVHRSNMSKLGADQRPIFREDGKVLKGPNYTDPDLSGFVPDPIEGSYSG